MAIRSPFVCGSLVALLAAINFPVHAQEFAPVKSRGEIQVEYIYESSGSWRGGSSKTSDQIVWRAKRNATLTAEVFAIQPQEVPIVHPLQDSTKAALQSKADQAAAVQTDLAPSIATMEDMAKRCGDDEACMIKEAMNLAQQMAGNGQTEVLGRGIRDVVAASKTVERYQFWGGNFGTGSYQIDETANIVNADPICIGKPDNVCRRKEVRQGSGTLPAKIDGVDDLPTGGEGIVTGVEWDSVDNTLALRLPVPHLTPGTETITSDEPDGTYSTPIARGTRPKMLNFPVTNEGDKAPLIVKIKGDWRQQSGEQTLTLKGKNINGGKLIIRWRFTAL